MKYIIKQKRSTFCFSYNTLTLFWQAFIITITILLNSKPTVAQIIPDNSLGSENSRISPDPGNPFIQKVDGGATRGGNLFHSFEQFSIPTSGTAYFNNVNDIQNIISRVTGNSVSIINGSLQANSNANLFLLNPNGIILGSNASLNIGGSFLASTANTINFADGVQFSSSNSQSTLLTVSVPIGLGFTSLPGSIRVEGNGHNLLTNVGTVGNPVIGAGQSTVGLKTNPEQAIILVGGDVNIEGGIITAPSGQIEIGSVDSGLVKIESVNNEGWTLNYDNVQNFRDIKLEKLALLDASGVTNGNIFLRGRDIAVVDPSLVIISNFGVLDSGKVSVNASGNIELIGIRNPTNPNAQDIGPARGIFTQNLLSGKAANIEVFADNIFIRDSGGVGSASFGSGSGGDIFVVSKGITELYGTDLPTTGLLTGTIATSSYNTGKAGNIKLYAENLSVRDGSTISSTTLGNANAGNVELSVTNNIDVLGGALTTFDLEFINNSFLSSSIGSNALFGKAGDVLINTKNLSIMGGARIESSTVASGLSGSLVINASNSILVDGTAANFTTPSLIISSANVSNPFFREFLDLPTIPEGESGSVTVNTNQLNVLNGAQISARNDGTNNGGSIQIDANSVNLNNKGRVTTSTASGEGGNISLIVRNSQLRNGSSITATAGEAGNGGNIIINTDTLVALENSDITANALNGRGGNIKIAAQGIFGIESRARLTPLSDITASSELGISGTVQINTLDTNPINGLVGLPPTVVDSSRLIVQDCSAREDSLARGRSKFIISGRGGLPPQPSEPLRAEAIAIAESGEENRSANVTVTRPISSTPTQIVEAQGWVINERGQVILTAQPVSATLTSSLSTQVTCYGP
ncbi:filamentous hemagglutinin N-terminal domain-containing protein [Synechocystis sp. PCC 7509]|uniref:two-partner secretion domain-containing protein n=1 Tax=Synechocystis sp. PCC 7509 TaxID=927677 RepID=UPI000686147C|nr:filamentous hemagglutinin N-terminal domain-containing protein [Synechocystis sp. PCC 7509]